MLNWNFNNTKSPDDARFNNKTNSFNHALSAYVYPFKNHTLGFTWD